MAQASRRSRRTSARARSAGPVILRLAGSPSTPTTVAPGASTRAAGRTITTLSQAAPAADSAQSSSRSPPSSENCFGTLSPKRLPEPAATTMAHTSPIARHATGPRGQRSVRSPSVLAAVGFVALAGQAIVESVAAVELVGLVVVAAHDHVVAVAADEDVLAGAAGHGVIAEVAAHGVAARAAVEVVVAGVAPERVVAGPAADGVVAGLAADDV